MDVLLVDDEVSIREMLRLMIELRVPGCQVVGEAADGVEAIEKVAELMPEVVVMDYKMPRLNGAEATRQIKERFPQVRVLGYTSLPVSLVGLLRAAGASEAFTKDDVGRLIDALGCPAETI